MRRLVEALAALALALVASACAAHNSHRVPIDLNAQLAPLIDEAWTVMEQSWTAPIPVGGVPVEVEVEPVIVQWLPYSPEVPPGGETLSQDELHAYVVDALRVQAPAGALAPYTVRLKLVTDLHDPDTLGIQVRCALVDPREGLVLARGASAIARFERLFCHGCRERWGGHGSELHHGPLPVFVDGGYQAGVGVGVYFPVWGSDSSSGYIKR